MICVTPLGLEPRTEGLESSVLPLHHRAIYFFYFNSYFKSISLILSVATCLMISLKSLINSSL